MIAAEGTTMLKRAAGPAGAALADARALAVLPELREVDPRPRSVIKGVEPVEGGVELKPGEEIPVPVEVPALPPNGDVKRIRARMTVSASAAPAEPEAVEVRVTSEATQTFDVAVVPPPLPRNLEVRLDGGETIWTHSGTLTAEEHELPDFAEAANRYLDTVRQEPGTPTTLTFLVRSETPGRVALSVPAQELEHAVLHAQTWPNPLDRSIRLDRNLELAFGTVAEVALDAPARGLKLAAVRLDLSGEAGAERLLGDVPDHDGREFATVSPEYAVAQGLMFSPRAGIAAGGVVRVAGVAAILEVEAQAELYVEIRRDEDGAPAAEAPVGGVSFPLAPREAAPRPAWAYAALAEPVDVPVGVPHWIIVRGIRATARLALGAQAGGYLGALGFNRGGQLWKPMMGAPAALVRVAYLADPDSQTAPVTVTLEGGAELRPDVTAQPQRLTLEAGSAPARMLVVTSHARASLVVANVVQELSAA